MNTQALFSLVSGLSGVTRFSMLKMCHRENVLEHTGMMACFAFALGTRLNQIEGFQFDLALLLQKAIVHDWDETVTGDIARPTKYFSTALRIELRALEAEGIANIATSLGLMDLPNIYGDAKEGPEGSLVALCDIACAIHRCWEEVLVFNNLHFVFPAQRLRKVLHKTVKSLQLGQMSHEQWCVIDTFALDLNKVLNDVLLKGNGHLKEINYAN